MKTSAARRLVGPALGVFVFVAVTGIWQLWAGAEDSFLVPTASEVFAPRICPVSGFLAARFEPVHVAAPLEQAGT